MTDKERLAIMLTTGIKPQSGSGDLGSGDMWEVGELGLVSALTGKAHLRNDVCDLDLYVAFLPRKHPMDKCLKEAEQRIADYEATDGDVEECLRLIEERNND